MQSFIYSANPARVIFGSGTVSQVRDEVTRLGGSRALLLSGPSVPHAVQRAHDELGDLLVARFDGAAMHTPVEVTERALATLRANAADCLVAVGGGSTTGLAKALALRTDLPQVVLPTTYAGSEVTTVLGETTAGRKATLSSPAVLPETVIYDVDFTLTLPVPLTVTSSVNALAHAVEALYSGQANPAVDALALEAIARIGNALPRAAADPRGVPARADLLLGAWLAGTCMGSVSMGLHHRLCHMLGGRLGLPHAETHTVVLPHVMAYHAPAVPEVMQQVAARLSAAEAATAVFDLVTALHGPASLSALGMAEADIETVAADVTGAPPTAPRTPTVPEVTGLLRDAWQGSPPRAYAMAAEPDVE